MEFLKITGLILISVILVSSLPAFDKSMSALITISSCVIVLLYVTNAVSPAVETVANIINTNDFKDFDILFKSMGISLLTQFVADVATDSGNKALANQMIFVGKIAVIMLALPIFTQILEIIGSLIK